MKYLVYGHGYYLIRENPLGGFLYNKHINKKRFGMGTVEHTSRREEVLKRLGLRNWEE